MSDISFGDTDIEDEWDDNDPFNVRLDLLERLLEALVEQRRGLVDDRFPGRRSEALRLVRKLLLELDDNTMRLERVRVSLGSL